MNAVTPKMRSTLRFLVESKSFSHCVTLLILLNTVVLGLETYPDIMLTYGKALTIIDKGILCFFVVELMMRLVVHGRQFFKDPWSVFDVLVVAIAFVPSQNAFGALRAARALRALRLISIFPKLRKVIEGLVLAIPGIMAIAGVMGTIILVFGLMASKLYGASFPEWFGNLHLSVFSLFQIMTLEGWPDIVRNVMKVEPYAWVFFVIYILIATFSVLNLFIAVVVDAMQRNHTDEVEESHEKMDIINQKLDRVLSLIERDKC